jgi:hypothetical protein
VFPEVRYPLIGGRFIAAAYIQEETPVKNFGFSMQGTKVLLSGYRPNREHSCPTAGKRLASLSVFCYNSEIFLTGITIVKILPWKLKK